MTRPGLKYVVAAPPYHENNGGSLFLHHLVDRLNRMGEQAVIWPMPPIVKPDRRTRLRNLIFPPKFDLSADLDTPLSKRPVIDEQTVVVYPEVVIGNPLGARNVVRWLMYKPGLMFPYEFGDNELFFTVGTMSDMPEVTGGAQHLHVWIVNPAYRNEGRSDRSGACYIVRKGHAKARIPQTADALLIDGLPHSEVNRIFNRCETFYSYDEATMYSQYAAICGCTSIVIPGLYRDRDEWVKENGLARYGIAYGLDDVGHARATRHLTEGVLKERAESSAATIRAFVETTHRQFGR